jgi:Fe-S cluster biogenesis protein NfuA
MKNRKNQIEQDMAPFGFMSDGQDESTFIDKDGDLWHTDEYGDQILYVGLYVMDLNESNVTKSLSEIAPYIEADGGFVEFVEIEEETNYVKVRLGGACTSCAMSAMTLKQGIESKIMQDIPDCNGVIQVL